jgi:hypothetical protein
MAGTRDDMKIFASRGFAILDDPKSAEVHPMVR